MYVRMYVCMYEVTVTWHAPQVPICVYMYACMHVCMHVCVSEHACTYACMSKQDSIITSYMIVSHKYTCIHMHTCVPIAIRLVHAHTHTHTYIHMRHVYIRSRGITVLHCSLHNTCIHATRLVYMHMRSTSPARIYMHTRMHACMCAYTTRKECLLQQVISHTCTCTNCTCKKNVPHGHVHARGWVHVCIHVHAMWAS
jgi:hypothetical protein